MMMAPRLPHVESLQSLTIRLAGCVTVSIFSIARADTPLETKEETEQIEIGDRSPTQADLGPSDSGLPDRTESELADADIELLMDLEMPTVSAAARRNQKLIEIPHAISIVTADDIRRSEARSITDALRLVAGVDVADLSLASSAVSPRGLHGC
jgi:outer membrane receptor protein involved in Fe transport